MKKYDHKTELKQLDPEQDLSSKQQELLNASVEARKNSHSPYSNFKIGSGVLLEDGTIVTGNNQENRAFPSGLCAERVAIFSAAAHYPTAKIDNLIVYTDTPDRNLITPCGGCRQAIFEYEHQQNKPIKILIANGKEEIWMVDSIENLLPFPFVYTFEE